jgi:hypothetical protein
MDEWKKLTAISLEIHSARMAILMPEITSFLGQKLTGVGTDFAGLV